MFDIALHKPIPDYRIRSGGGDNRRCVDLLRSQLGARTFDEHRQLVILVTTQYNDGTQ